MAPVPLFLVTGFLGSGKTTLLKKIINDNTSGKKIAVIQNEFAPANVDGADLKNLGKPFKILEINNGSVFCICLLSDFISSLKAFIEQETPDLVILESSGLADPIAVSEILLSERIKHLVYLASCWCIVDVLNFNKIQSLLIRLKHQITIADFLVLNKIDLVNSEELQEVKESIRSINHLAVILESSFCNIDLDKFYQGIRNKSPYFNKAGSVDESCGRPAINTGVFKTSRKISLENLRYIINKYIDRTIRIKGYVFLDNTSMATVQTVFSEVDITLMDNKTGNTALILMGEGFNLSEFSRDFRKLTG